MFTEGAPVRNTHFYGNDGVCLFKYLVRTNDPQKEFVWALLATNLLCFPVIVTSYLYIHTITRRSGEHLRQNQNMAVRLRKRRQVLQRKIALIIGSDFVCWSPFIVISLLHATELVDVSEWYGFLSIVFLPINSVINPLIYDETVPKYLLMPIWKRFFG